MGTVTARGRKWLLIVSWSTSFVSAGYCFAYASQPTRVGNSLLGNLADHWVWAVIQAAIAVAVMIGQLRGGLGLRTVHAVASIVQCVYLALWLCSVAIVHVGYFVWPGVLFLVVGHAALSRMSWPTRAQVKGRLA